MTIRQLLTKNLGRLGSRVLPETLHQRLTLWGSLFDGSAELELAALQEIPVDGTVAIDIGANRGDYSRVMHRYFKSVIAFEPNPNMAAMLRRALPEDVVIHATALSNQNGETQFYVPCLGTQELDGWGSLSSGYFATEMKQTVEENSYTVEVKTLDSFDFENVGLIKMDVEGHEAAALEGGLKTIQREHPTLILEIRPPDQQPIKTLLESLGYQLCVPENIFSKQARRRWDRANFIYVHKSLTGRTNFGE